MSAPKYAYIVPRSFRLRQELEFAEKGTPIHAQDKGGKVAQRDPHAGFITFGLDDEMQHDSVQHYAEQLADWNGTIIGPQNVRCKSKTSTRSSAHELSAMMPAHACAAAAAAAAVVRFLLGPGADIAARVAAFDPARRRARSNSSRTRVVICVLVLTFQFMRCIGAVWCVCVETALGERMYSVRIRCGPRYPQEPPSVTFVQRIAMSGVCDQSGLCSATTFVPHWTRDLGMYDYLCAIRAAMPQAARIKQPSPEAKYQQPKDAQAQAHLGRYLFRFSFEHRHTHHKRWRRSIGSTRESDSIVADILSLSAAFRVPQVA